MITNLNKGTLPEPNSSEDSEDLENLEEFTTKVPFRFLRNSPIKSQYNNTNKRYLTAVASRELTERNIRFLTNYRNNVSTRDTFEIFYQDVFVSDIEKKQYKEFKFELLPSIESTVNHPGGSNVLRGATTIPDVKPGIPIRTVMKHRNINIMGGKNVIQTIGIDSKFIILVGAFIGDNNISSHQEAKFFDEQIVQPGLRVSITIRAHFGADLALPNPKKEGEFKNLKGFISEFKLYAVRREKSYYSITIIIEDFPSLPDPIEDFRLEQQKLKEIELKKSPTPPPNTATSQPNTATSQVNTDDIPNVDKSSYEQLISAYNVSSNNFKQLYNVAKLPSNATEQQILDRIKLLNDLITKLTNTDTKAKSIIYVRQNLEILPNNNTDTTIIKEKDIVGGFSVYETQPLKTYYEYYYKNKRQLTEVYKDLGYLNYKIFTAAWPIDFFKRQTYQNASKISFSKAELHGQTLEDQTLKETSIEDFPSELNTVAGIKTFITTDVIKNYGLP